MPKTRITEFASRLKRPAPPGLPGARVQGHYLRLDGPINDRHTQFIGWRHFNAEFDRENRASRAGVGKIELDAAHLPF